MSFGYINHLYRISINIPKLYIHIIRPTQNQVSVQRRKPNLINSISMTLDHYQGLSRASHIKVFNDPIWRSSHKSLLILINIHRDNSLSNMSYKLTLFSHSQIIHQNLSIRTRNKEFISISWTPMDFINGTRWVQYQSINLLPRNIYKF